MSSEILAIKWNNKESKGCVDIFPTHLFAKVGVRSQLDHTVIGPKDSVAAARCKLTVSDLAAEFDYRAFSDQNKKWDWYLGVLRIMFANNKRNVISAIAWKDTYKQSFRVAEAEIVDPPLSEVVAYKKGKKSVKKTFRAITERPGQVEFRRKLMIAYGGRCCISGCSIPAVLEGAHIDPYYGPASNNPQNGLLLRLDLHALLDMSLMAVDPTSKKVYFSEEMLIWPEYASLHRTAKVANPVNGGSSYEPSMQALERRWAEYWKVK